MGYCMEQKDQDFFLSADKKVEAFKHVHKKLLDERDKVGGGRSGFDICIRSYSWVDNSELDNAQNIEDILDAFRWHPETDGDGNITSIYFEGEKLGNDEHLFEAIALFVKKDSFIEMSGEDGYLWRWIFDGKTCQEIPATITWE